MPGGDARTNRDPPLPEVTSRIPTISVAAGRCVQGGGVRNGRRDGEGAAGQTARAALAGGSEWPPQPRASPGLPARSLAHQSIGPGQDISCDQASI